jgi:hypothetical protein
MPSEKISRKSFIKLAGGAAGIGALSYYLGLRKPGEPVPTGPTGQDGPDYIDDSSGFPVFRGPYLQKDLQLAACLFPADLAALTQLCNQTLNAARPAPFEYVPVLAHVLVVFAEMKVASLDERDQQVGLIPETEVGFWLLTAAMQKTPVGKMAHHLAWFIPYLFVDDSSAIATGREVYGFNKQAVTFNQAGQVEMPNFSADAIALRKFGPDALAKKERLLELASPNPQAAPPQWNDWQAANSSLSAALLRLVRSDMGSEIVSLAAQAALENIPLVFLKQLRHATHTRKAAYQSIVEARMRITTFHSGGFFNQPLELQLQPLDSHPLAQKLGLQATQRSGLGAWLKADCTLGDGVEYG